MTEPTPTRAEVEAIDRAIERLRALHDYAGRPAWDQVVREELGASFQALRERAEAADSAYDMLHDVYEATMCDLTAARRAEAAAWNDAIEAVRPVALASFASGCDAHELDEDIRALRRAAPTEER